MANAKEFEDVLACIGDMHGGGRPLKFPEGSAESVPLRDLSQKDKYHWQMPFEDVAKELGIKAARSTLEHIFHDQHGLFRRKATHKPCLSPQHIEAHLAFCHMALHILINHIVFTDEMWVEFNSVRREQNVTRPVGIDAHEWAIHDRNHERTIRVMFWGAICLGQYSFINRFNLFVYLVAIEGNTFTDFQLRYLFARSTCSP